MTSRRRAHALLALSCLALPACVGPVEELGPTKALMRDQDARGPAQRLVGDGAPATSVDLLFLPEGYTAEQMGSFREAVDGVVSDMASHPDFAPHWSAFNVWRQDVVSREMIPLEGRADTAFDVEESGCAMPRTGAGYEAADRLGEAVSADVVVLVVQSDVFYGGCSAGPLISVHSRSGADTVLHELGHSLPGLADEYGQCEVRGEPSAPNRVRAVNLSPSARREDLPWADLVDAGTPLPTPATGTYAGVVGAFLGPETEHCTPTDGYYRPELTCLMNLEDRLCSVCRREWEAYFDALAAGRCSGSSCQRDRQVIPGDADRAAEDDPASCTCNAGCDYCWCGTDLQGQCPADYGDDADCDCGCQFQDGQCEAGAPTGSDECACDSFFTDPALPVCCDAGCDCDLDCASGVDACGTSNEPPPDDECACDSFFTDPALPVCCDAGCDCDLDCASGVEECGTSDEWEDACACDSWYEDGELCCDEGCDCDTDCTAGFDACG